MKPRMLSITLLAAFAAPATFAATHVLLPAEASDMVPSQLVARPAMLTTTAFGVAAPQPHSEHQPISASWALPHDAPVQTVPQAFTRASREYWTDVSATELQRGVTLPLTAPAAIIRLSPSDTQRGRLDAAAIQLRLNGHSMDAGNASRQIAGTQALRAVGMDVPDASTVLQLKPELGAGEATLQAPAASGRYVVHVFEPKSPFTVSAAADRGDALLGRPIHVRIAMREGDKERPLQAAGGFLRAPDGSTTLLDYRADTDGSYSVDALPDQASRTPGLWELHSFTVGDDGHGHAVRRDTTSVFAVAVPDARLSGTADTRAAGGGIDITLGVQVQSASRFAASGVLYGRDASGRLVPAAYAQSADWLNTGDGSLVLHFTPASLAGIGAPYELRDLRLQDQPAISLVERRALALRFDRP